MNFAKFGPGGNGESFYAEKKKNTFDMPEWLNKRGLDAYEYEGGNGLTAGEATLRKIGEKAKQYGILMSLHTPYYISLSSVEIEKRQKSVDYIKRSLAAAELLGADTIVIHSGSAGKISRNEAMNLSKDTLSKVIEEVGETHIKLGIETMGKINQLGTLDEVIEQCKVDKHYVPVVDFGHMNARELGKAFMCTDDYRRVFDKIALNLGDSVACNLHCHFSKIEFTEKGEKRHLTFDDNVYGPDFEPLMEALVKDDLTPRIICESAGTMPEDALKMKNYYMSLL